ncbi:Cytochrome c oxidase copper chaperone [Myotisia sp. PD_48]|nr:Cytochrome c oxidase copper chaperone [Myotisia sp. PD_48]
MSTAALSPSGTGKYDPAALGPFGTLTLNPSLASAGGPIPAASTSAEVPSKPKPCCVCKPEKSARDECMLFSKSEDPTQQECKSFIQQYKTCMAGYGFKV